MRVFIELVNADVREYAILIVSDARVSPMDFEEAEKLWADRAKRFLKAELKRADVTYEELARLLREHHGLNETKVSISNKLSRGTFSAAFLMAVLKAIGRQKIDLEEA
jgi:hypothetical protein